MRHLNTHSLWGVPAGSDFPQPVDIMMSLPSCPLSSDFLGGSPQWYRRFPPDALLLVRVLSPPLLSVLCLIPGGCNTPDFSTYCPQHFVFQRGSLSCICPDQDHIYFPCRPGYLPSPSEGLHGHLPIVEKGRPWSDAGSFRSPLTGFPLNQMRTALRRPVQRTFDPDRVTNFCFAFFRRIPALSDVSLNFPSSALDFLAIALFLIVGRAIPPHF